MDMMDMEHDMLRSVIAEGREVIIPMLLDLNEKVNELSERFDELMKTNKNSVEMPPFIQTKS